MADSNHEQFLNKVRSLNIEFQEWMERELKQSNSANLRTIINDYEQKLKRIETENGIVANSTNSIVSPCPYQLTPKQSTKVVHFIRHGHGYHNPPMSHNRLDARLTPLGWKQCFQLRQHLLNMKTPFEVELVVTSPLTRALETAVGVFGFEKPQTDSELIVLQRSADETGPGHPAFYKSRHLPIIAQELCRECLQGNKCDTRRTLTELKAEFPGVDFSKVEYEEDLLSQNVKKEWGEPAKKRALSFVKWMIHRPQTYIAVVSHCAFLSFVIQQCCAHLPKHVFQVSKEYFQNCELRTFVLSRSDYSMTKIQSLIAPFKPEQE
eukprot:g3309.t1